MASLITVRLDKGNSPNLGFRLQGGKDFGTPLVVQKVNGGSPAERAGLVAGDSVIKVNNVDVFNLRHKDAQDVIVRAGHAFEVTVQRGGSTWKPSVIPTGPLHSAAPVVTKTSLAATKQDNSGSIGTGHNLSAKPFSPQLNGTVNGAPKVVNNQYNSPLKLYSEESIAETLSAQTEVLSTGVLGVNFKKNEKNYDATNSAVYRMLQEAEKEPKTPEPVSPRPDLHATHSHAVGGRQVTSPRSNTPHDDHSRLSSRLGEYPNSYNPNQEGVTKCTECERVIVGVFVRIKDKNLHVECFKCSTCGTSLKNVGYYNINNKLYCDVHAKLAARANPPAPNLLPITVPPGSKAPASAISTALATHSLPSPSSLSPKTNFAQPFQAGNYSSTPKPFSSVSAPISTPTYNTLPRAAPAAAPLSPVALAPAPSYSPASSAGRLPTAKPAGSIFRDRSVQTFVWPPPPEEPEVPTACPLYVAPSSHLKVNPKTLKQEDLDYSDTLFEAEDFEVHEFNNNMYQQPKMSLCSEEVCEITGRRSATECVETIYETLETQKLVENAIKNRPRSPPPLDRNVVVREMKKATGTTKIAETSERVCSLECSSVTSCETEKSCELKRLTDFKPNTVECKLKSQVENVVPQKWESPMVQALRIDPDSRSKGGDPFTQIPKKVSSGTLASALAIAPSEPFYAQSSSYKIEPVPFPEQTEPYFPPEHPLVIEPKDPKPEKPESKFVKALQTAPERPFTPVNEAPVKKKKDPTDEFFKDLPKPRNKLTMREALTTASDRPYTPLFAESVKVDESVVEGCEIEKEKKNVQKPLKPAILPASFQKPTVDEIPRAPKPFPITTHEKKEGILIQEKKEEKEIDVKSSSSKVVETHKTQSTVEETVENVDEDTAHGMYPLFKGFSCSFGNKSEHSQFNIEISTTPPIINRDNTHTPSIKISRTGESSESITKKITEESQRHETSHQTTKQIEKQSEQVEIKKPTVALALHKPDKLPQYQVNLSENLEADYLMMQKIESAKIQHQEKSKAAPPPKPPREFYTQPVITVQSTEPPREFQTKPVITVQPGESTLQPEQSFKPVCDDRPPSSTFSPRPRPITPSMINRPPPVIPYYQASLAAQEYKAPPMYLLDPTSPAISRSPSPCPERSHSPFPSKTAAAVRPKSPAAGPPPNPLTTGKPLPTPRDAKVEEAKKNVSHFIPQYRERVDGVEKVQPGPPQVYNAYVQARNVSGIQQVQEAMSTKESLQVDFEKKILLKEDRKIEDAAKSQVMSYQSGQATVSTAMFEQTHSDHLEQLKKSESQSVESLQGGAVQVQRKKTVTEEFEHTQKSKTMQIEKNVSTTKGHPFKEVKNPEALAIIGLHVTNPQPIVSPFLKANASQQSVPLPKQQLQQPQQPQQPQQTPILQQPQSSQLPKPFKHVPAPSTASPIRHVPAPSGSAKKPDQSVNRSNIPVPNTGSGSGGGRQAGAIGVAPKRGRGVLNTAALTGTRIPLCASCHSHIRGPFITALGKIWCPDHFICATPSCRRPLQDLGFVEEQGQLYCEYCFEQYLAPACSKCNSKIKGDCLKAIGKNYHPECFACFYCGKLFGNSPFFLEDGNPYCDADWNELFTTKCYACGFPVEAGDRWVEALNNNYHSQCFNCTMCKKNLEGQSFFAKGGRPFCKNHAR